MRKYKIFPSRKILTTKRIIEIRKPIYDNNVEEPSLHIGIDLSFRIRVAKWI